MANNTKAGFQNIRNIAAPREYAPQERIGLDKRIAGGNLAGELATHATDQYFNNAARTYGQAVDQVARSVFKGHDFTKGVAEKVDPQYKFEALFSNEIQQSKREQPIIAKAIDDRALKQEQEMRTGLVLRQMVEDIDKSADYNEWLPKAQMLEKSLIDQYGATPPGFQTQLDEKKRLAQDHFKRGQISETQNEFVNSAVNDFLLTEGKKVTVKNAATFMEEKILPLIKNPESDNWKREVFGVLGKIVGEAPNPVEGVKIANKFEEYLTPTEKSALVNLAIGITKRNERISKDLLAQNHEMAQNYFNRGISVPEEKLLNPKDIITSRFIEEYDLGKQDLEGLYGIAQATGRYDIITPIANYLKKDFESDYTGALNNWRSPNETVPPLEMPKIAQGDVKDELGNIIASKGDVMEMDRFLDSVKRRGVHAMSTKNTYGEVVKTVIGAEEMREIRTFRDSLDSFEKRTRFDLDFLGALGVNEVGDKYTDFTLATGDDTAASVYRQLKNPPRIIGGANTVMKNYQVYDSMRREDPEKFAEHSELVNDKLKHPVSTNTGITILPDTIPLELRTFLEVNSIGATGHMSKKDAKKALDKQYFFWSKKGFLSSGTMASLSGNKAPYEKIDVDFRDWYYGDVSTAQAILGRKKMNVERHAAVTASQADYQMLNKIIQGQAWSDFAFDVASLGISIYNKDMLGMMTSMQSVMSSTVDMGVRGLIPDSELAKKYTLDSSILPDSLTTDEEVLKLMDPEHRKKLESAKAEKGEFDLLKEGKIPLSLNTIMMFNKNYTIKNYKNSLKDFALVDVDDNGLTTIVRDAKGKEVIFSVP